MNSFDFINADAEEFFNTIHTIKSKDALLKEVSSCNFKKISGIKALVLSSLINEAVTSISYPN